MKGGSQRFYRCNKQQYKEWTSIKGDQYKEWTSIKGDQRKQNSDGRMVRSGF